MHYESLFSLLRDVRDYPLRGKETLIPMCSHQGVLQGYCTADTDGPSTEWSISRVDVRGCIQRIPDRKLKDILREGMSSFSSQKGLLTLLLSGKLGSLEEDTSVPEIQPKSELEPSPELDQMETETPPESPEDDLEGALTFLSF